MKTTQRILIIFCFTVLLLSTGFAFAEDEVLPPPTVDEVAAGEVSDIKEKPANLQQDLQPPKDGEAVDIRSYQRKDGATITEYAIHNRVYKIKVEPAGGLPAYYLYDRDGDGRFELRLPGGGRRISPPAWVLKEF